jgi:hypothetical protein
MFAICYLSEKSPLSRHWIADRSLYPSPPLVVSRGHFLVSSFSSASCLSPLLSPSSSSRSQIESLLINPPLHFTNTFPFLQTASYHLPHHPPPPMASPLPSFPLSAPWSCSYTCFFFFLVFWSLDEGRTPILKAA